MSEEIKDIFECLKKYANLTPDAIDDLYYLEGTIEDLQQKVEQLENIRKETIEYINNEIFKRTILVGVGTKKYTRNILDNILNILNKGSEE